MRMYDIRPPIKYWGKIPKNTGRIINLRKDVKIVEWKGELYYLLNGKIARYKINK